MKHYEKYYASHLTREMVTDLKYVETVTITITQLKDINPNTSANRVQSEAFYLPKLSLPNSEGYPINWVSFWDLYKCSVRDNENLKNIQKLTHLKGQVVGEEHQLIEGFKLQA